MDEQLYLSLFLPIIITIIGGTIALLQVRNNHLLKARLEWANNLKSNLSSTIEWAVKHQEVLRMIADDRKKNVKKHESEQSKELPKMLNDEYYATKYELLRFSSILKISLYNRDKNSSELLSAIEELIKMSEEFNPYKFKEFDELIVNLIALSSKVINEEWNKSFSLLQRK